MKKLIQKNRQAAILFWFLTLSYMSLIFFLSSIAYPDIVPLPKNSDKVIHFFEYAVLSVLFFLSFKKSGVIRNILWLSIVLATFYGITDEYHQSYVPGRYSSIGDVVADFIGSAAGALSLKLILKG
ncbi:MAG: VanZ family protein [Thermodesulfovibrionia bacterium]|nr:VanZ family protein [Thermodesulfovibrionia bacterium]